MAVSKRELLMMGGAAGFGIATLGSGASAKANQNDLDSLPNLAASAKAISVQERKSRVEKAQKLMETLGIEALLLEAGSAMVYFTGIRWWRSERFTGVIIPRKGEIAVVTPYFEEPSIRQSMTFGDDVRTWHENESPFDLVAGILKDRGITGGKLAIEETVRFFIMDEVRKSAPFMEVVAGAPVTRGCRMYKSSAELELMQIANDITLAAYKYTHKHIEKGMEPNDIRSLMNSATAKLGGRAEFSIALLGEASAYPHGSDEPQRVEEGGIILMDCGCGVLDYESDISRTWVYGEPSSKQRKIWNTVKRGQELALETARVGVPAGRVDEAVRSFYESEGYGPGYKTPGLSHRLGHGIGMDGHEPINFVQGEETLLAPGMCFSNEPGIYSFGEFGVRLEDCLYMTEEGPVLFSPLSPSIDKPFG